MKIVFILLKGVCLAGLAGACVSMYVLRDGALYWQTWNGYAEEGLAAMWLCAYALLCMAENSGWIR